jgi:hypothetical protein
MSKINDLKAALDKHLAHARSIHDTATHAESQDASRAVEQAQRDLSAHITDGAKPCPVCDRQPIGMEQPVGARARGEREGRVEYEIGCISCSGLSVRGGLLPRHAVEAWNEKVDASIEFLAQKKISEKK